MEKTMVIALLEKYWNAETTVAEEKALGDYFRTKEDLDEDLAPYRDIFLYFGEEARVTAGPDLGQRILDRVGIKEPVRRKTGRSFRVAFLSAAAVIGALAAGIFLFAPHEHGRQVAAVPDRTIQDTYDDPEQAMAAVRHALMVASKHLNEGRRSLTGDK
ncbi:MAG TPA: hypothetical protein VHE54_02405 [Puia sp.]|nr:hypothetical protein [Puia sp.]